MKRRLVFLSQAIDRLYASTSLEERARRFIGLFAVSYCLAQRLDLATKLQSSTLQVGTLLETSQLIQAALKRWGLDLE